MKFQLTFSLDKPEIPTKDYRRIFASIIKNALSRYMDGQLFEKFYKDTKQKDFTWSVIFNKPEFSGEGIKLGKNEIKMIFYDKKVRRLISVIILVVILAMVATMVIPYLI